MTCNSASTDETGFVKFSLWSEGLISKLKDKYEVTEIDASDLLQKFKIFPSNEETSETAWEKDQSVWEPKLGK